MQGLSQEGVVVSSNLGEEGVKYQNVDFHKVNDKKIYNKKSFKVQLCQSPLIWLQL